MYITVEESCRCRLDITIVSLTNSKYQFTKLLHSHEFHWQLGVLLGVKAWMSEWWSGHISSMFQANIDMDAIKRTESNGGGTSERACVSITD